MIDRRSAFIYKAVSLLLMFGMGQLAAVYVLFLGHNGLTPMQRNLVNVVYWATPIFMEIPTGKWADRWLGRKGSVVCGCVGEVIALVIYGSAHTFGGFILAEFLSGVSSSFISGAFQAWLKDAQREKGYMGLIDPILREESHYSQLGNFVAIFSGAAVAQYYGLAVVWFVAAFWVAMAAIVAIVCMHEPPHFTEETKHTYTSDTTWQTLAQQPMLRFVLAAWMLNVFIMQVPNMQWQPLFKEAGGSNMLIMGGIMVVANAGLVIGAWIARRHGKTDSHFTGLLTAMFFTGIGIIGVGAVTGFTNALAWYGFHEVGRGYFTPVRQGLINAELPEKNRATNLSICTMPYHFAGVVGLLASGAFETWVSRRGCWVVFGLVLCLGTLVLFWRYRQFRSA